MTQSRIAHINSERVEQFMSLYTAYQRHIYSYVMTFVPTTADADDIFQEVSVVLWRKFSQFQPEMSFFAWACGIIRFEVLKFREKHTRAAMLIDPSTLELLSETAVNDIEHHDDAQRQALGHCLERLPSADRQLLRSRYEERVRVQTLADRTGRSPNAISKSLGRIRHQLLDCILVTLKLTSREGRLS